MLAEKRARILAVACAASAAFFLCTRATAQTPVFVDNFNNGSVADSDTQPGFWTTVIAGAGTVNEFPGGPINLTAAPTTTTDNYPFSEIGSSSLQSSFNFFQQPVILQVSGLNYSAASSLKSLTEFNFGSQVIANTGTIQTEYNEPSDFSLEISPPSGPNGQIDMGLKTGYPNHSTPFDSFQAIGTKPGRDYPTQELNGQIRSFTLVLDSQFYYLSVVTDTSATDPTPVTTNYAGGLNIPNSAWNTSGTYAPGDPSLNIETQLNDTTSTADTASLNINQLKVNQLSMTYTNASGDNNWFNAANWSGLTNVIDPASVTKLQGSSTALADIVVPDYTSSSATLPQASAPTTINIDNGGGNTITLGTLNINSTQPYTINSTAIGLSTNGSTGQINVTSGSHTINAVNFNLYGNTAVNVAAGASLNLNGYLFTQDVSYTLAKTGGGLLNVTSLQFFAGVTVNGGTLKVMPSPSADVLTPTSGASYINALNITSGKLDLTNNEMVIDYSGASPLQTVRGYLQTGALMSSDASVGDGTALGYAEATEIGQTNGFNAQNGQSIPTDTTSICILYTYDGDVNLDGIVNGADYALMVSGTGKDWFNGDLNYDGVENADDWALFQLGSLESARGNIENFPAPEPGSLAILGAAGFGLIRRRAVSR